MADVVVSYLAQTGCLLWLPYDLFVCSNATGGTFLVMNQKRHLPSQMSVALSNQQMSLEESVIGFCIRFRAVLNIIADQSKCCSHYIQGNLHTTVNRNSMTCSIGDCGSRYINLISLIKHGGLIQIRHACDLEYTGSNHQNIFLQRKTL